MTLPGVTPYPPEFAARYRARGYWADRPLIAHFLDAFEAFADRVAVIDDTGTYTYAELAGASQRVALNLLDLGLRPADRVVLQLPNTRFFASLYFGLQRIGAIPIMALPSHRYRELRQFVGLSGAVAAVAPATAGDTDFAELHRRVAAEHPGLRLSILQGGEPDRRPPGVIGLEELHERRPGRHSPADLPRMGRYSVDDPALTPLFEVINGLGVPVLIDVGTTGMGAGMPGGHGTQIKHAHPLAVDQLAATFPGLTIIAAHPGWPWVEDMTAVALHKGNVYWDLSGWAPKHFPAGLRTDIRGRLQDKIMFGSDYPSLPLSRLLREWDELGFSEEVMHKVFHANAERVLGLKQA